MNSGSLMTAIAIVAAIWVQAGYEQRLRLRVARGQPLKTGLATLLASTGVLAVAEYVSGTGLISEVWQLAAATGATGVAIATVAWILICSTKTQAFNEGNAQIYEKVVRETVEAGQMNDLRVLAEGLRVSGRRLVAHAANVKTLEKGSKGGKAAEIAVRILDMMSSEKMMEVICLEGGRAITEIIKETERKWEEAAGWGTAKDLEDLIKKEKAIIVAATIEAARKRCGLLSEPERYATQMMILGKEGERKRSRSKLDMIWGDQKLLERGGWIAWALGIRLKGEETDTEKLEQMLLTAIDTYLRIGASGEAITNCVWQLIQCRTGMLGGVTSEEEQGSLRRKGEFLRNVQKLLSLNDNKWRAVEQEIGTSRTIRLRWNGEVVTEREDLVEKVSDCLLHFMWNAGRSGSTGMDSWEGWLGIRGFDITIGGQQTDDDDVTNLIGRRVDILIWQKIKLIKRERLVPVEMGFLSYYLRMEGMKTHPLLCPDKERAPRTYRRRMRLHAMVRRACQKHLKKTLQACPESKEMLEQDGMRVVEEAGGKTTLRYPQRTGMGNIYRWELELYDPKTGDRQVS